VFQKSGCKEVLAVLTSNCKELLAACRKQVKPTRKKPQEVDFLRTQKEVLARTLFLGCTVLPVYPCFSISFTCGLKFIKFGRSHIAV